MRSKDQILLESIYQTILEGVEDQQKQSQNLLIASKVGRDIWKNKNKPENQSAIEQVRVEIDPIYQQLLKIVEPYQTDQYGRNLAHLPELTKFYLQKPDLVLIGREYKTYMSLGSIKSKNTIKKETEFLKWAEGIHSAEAIEANKKEGKVETVSTDKVESEDKNKKYDDENVIVFLANNVEDPKQSVKNCITYGKGSSLCISGSSARSYYHDYRWKDKLTTYFVWLKKDNRYILIDSAEDGHYQYNNIFDNEDRTATPEQIIQKYPVLQKPFAAKVFASVPIQGKELDFYERFYNAASILDFNNLDDRLSFVNFNSVEWNQWERLPEEEIPIILKAYIEMNGENIPHHLLKQYPPLEKRYWQKKKQTLEIELNEWDEDDDIDFDADEMKMLMDDKELFNLAMEKIPRWRYLYEFSKSEHKMFLSSIKNGVFKTKADLSKKQNDLYGSFNIPEDARWGVSYSSIFPLNLPELKKVDGDMALENAYEVNLPNLEICGKINMPNAYEVNLPKLKESGKIISSEAQTVYLPQLQKAHEILASKASQIHIPELAFGDNLHFKNAFETVFPKLEHCRHLYFHNSRKIELPKLYACEDFSNIAATEINLPELEICHEFNVLARKINLPKLEIATSLYLGNVEKVYLPNLMKVYRSIHADNATEVDLSKLMYAKAIYAINALEVDLSNLNYVKEIHLRGAKKVIIPKQFLDMVRKFCPKDCEIIHPEERNVKTESFRQYFNRA